jgi:ABC-type transport system substrate-binding protein
MHDDDVRPRTARWPHLVGLLLVPLLLLAACGGSDDGSSAGGTNGGDTAASDVDPNGTLRLPFDLTISNGKLDPIDANAPTDFFIHYMVFDTLLHQDENGNYTPGLAASADITDPSTLSVKLKPNLKFQDGTDLNADAVKFSIQRYITANQGRAFRVAELSQVASMEATSATDLTIRLKTPIAGSFYNLLAHNETMPISPTAAGPGKDFNANPVGAGPFKFESYKAGDRLRLVKWADYPDAKKIRVGAVEIINVQAASYINAIRSKTIDAVQISPEQANELQGVAKTRSKSSPDSVLWVSLQCQAYAPLADLRVRQALNYATDKVELNQQLYAGKAEPMSQFWTKDSKYYNKALEQTYAYDLAKAKKLLADAGQPNLEMTMAATPGSTVLGQMPEVLQAQWAKAGIKLTIQNTTNSVTDYYVGKKMNSIPTPQVRSWTDKITRNFVPGSVGNTCDPQDPSFTALVQKLRGLKPDSDEAVQLWKDISKYESDHALGVWGLMTPVSSAWLDQRIGDIAWRPNQVGNLYPDIFKIYIKK